MSAIDGGPLAPLERYLDATAVSPPPDLVGRISARLLFEPPSTAPGRFLAALRARDARGILRGLGQNAATAFTPGTRSMLLRAQAMAIVLVTLSTIGFGSVAGLAATKHVTEQVVNELAGRSTKGSTSSSPAPAAPATPLVGRAAVQQTVEGPAGHAAAEHGTLGASGQACGLSAHSQAGQLEGPVAEGCPGPPDTGRPPGDERRPQAAAADKGPGAPRADKREDNRQADPLTGNGADRKAKTPSSGGKARATGSGRALPRPADKQVESRRDRD
jgi:hypothetical protein